MCSATVGSRLTSLAYPVRGSKWPPRLGIFLVADGAVRSMASSQGRERRPWELFNLATLGVTYQQLKR